MPFRFLWVLTFAACSLTPISLPIQGGAGGNAEDAVQAFHRANAGKYFAFAVYRELSGKNMTETDDPSKGRVVQLNLFRFNGDGTLQSVDYNTYSPPFDSSMNDSDLDTSPARYNPKTKIYGETPAQIDPANPIDPDRQWGIRKVRFSGDFSRVQIADDILGLGDWPKAEDVPLRVETKKEVFQRFGLN